MSNAADKLTLHVAKRQTKKKWEAIRKKIEDGGYATSLECERAMGKMSTCGFCKEYYAKFSCVCRYCPLTQKRCFDSERWTRFGLYVDTHHSGFPANGRRMAIALCNQVLRDSEKVELNTDKGTY